MIPGVRVAKRKQLGASLFVLRAPLQNKFCAAYLKQKARYAGINCFFLRRERDSNPSQNLLEINIVKKLEFTDS